MDSLSDSPYWLLKFHYCVKIIDYIIEIIADATYLYITFQYMSVIALKIVLELEHEAI